MANEMKACCGGFLVGEGLTMDGKVLKATGGGSGWIRKNVTVLISDPDDGESVFANHLVFAPQEYNFATKEEFINTLDELSGGIPTYAGSNSPTSNKGFFISSCFVQENNKWVFLYNYIDWDSKDVITNSYPLEDDSVVILIEDI